MMILRTRTIKHVVVCCDSTSSESPCLRPPVLSHCVRPPFDTLCHPQSGLEPRVLSTTGYRCRLVGVGVEDIPAIPFVLCAYCRLLLIYLVLKPSPNSKPNKITNPKNTWDTPKNSWVLQQTPFFRYLIFSLFQEKVTTIVAQPKLRGSATNWKPCWHRSELEFCRFLGRFLRFSSSAAAEKR